MVSQQQSADVYTSAGSAIPPAFSCVCDDLEFGSVRVSVAGEVDLATAPQLDRVLRRAETQAPLLILDLRELEFMDSSGAHLLQAADRRIRDANGRLVIVGASPTIMRLLALTGLDRDLKIVESALDNAAVAG